MNTENNNNENNNNMKTDDNGKKKEQKTMLNKKYRLPISINARMYKGNPIPYVAYNEDTSNREIVRFLDKNPENGGTLTPFNIQTSVVGACAVRDIVKKGDTTTVVFADGDRVVVKRHEGDKYDIATAVLWALGQKLFGKNLVRQIHNAIEYRLIDADAIHEHKMNRR